MTTQRLPRLVAALLAAGTTLTLFSAVVSIAPPQQRGELLARAAAPQPVPAQAGAAAPVTVALAAPAVTAGAE